LVYPAASAGYFLVICIITAVWGKTMTKKSFFCVNLRKSETPHAQQYMRGKYMIG